jgi:hypothetical protein
MPYIFEIMDEFFYPDTSIKRDIKCLYCDNYELYESIDNLCSNYIGYEDYGNTIIHRYELREELTIDAGDELYFVNTLRVIDKFNKSTQVWERSSVYLELD